MTRLAQIRAKLNLLQELDAGFSVFGADSHRYKMNSPLTEAEITSFETKNNLRLPEEYREYLTQIANGGAGPFYGLMALEENGRGKTSPAEPFPLTGDQPVFLLELYEEHEEPDEIIEKVYEETQRGVSYLSHEGCGMYSVLVINGPEYGHVWYFDFANDAGVFPLTHPATGAPLGFFDWLELWLDAALAHLTTGAKEIDGYANFISAELAARFNDATESS